MENSFYEKVLSDFKRHSYFISLRCQFLDDSGIYVVENNDLYFLLHKLNSVNESSYKRLIKNKLYDNATLIINMNVTSNFMKVNENNNINLNAKKGEIFFIDFYFRNKKVIKKEITKEEEVSIIHTLFKWDIACKCDDETGVLLIDQ
jgi:hypothetical protein